MNQIIYAKDTLEFVTVGVEYCSLMERAASFESTEFIETTLKVLPLLYLKATLLPPVVTDYNGATEEFVDEDAYQYVLLRLSNLLGAHDSYLEVFKEDMQYSDTPLAASISEDLADIYQDIKNFVSAYSLENEEVMHDALLLCTENFASYWGQKLTNVLRALHGVRYSPDFQEQATQEEMQDEADYTPFSEQENTHQGDASQWSEWYD